MIFDLDSRCYIARHPRWARRFPERLRGMIGRRFVTGKFDALIFERCDAIHCCFMSITIDVLFIDSGFRVVAMRRGLRPWRFASGPPGSTVIELPEGTIDRAGVRCGHRINLNATLSAEAVEKLCRKAILKAEPAPFAGETD